MLIEVRVRGSVEGPSVRTFHSLPVRIGREVTNDLVLPFPFVSRHHGRIEMRGTDAVLVDGGSTNGIAYEGRTLSPSTPVPLGPEEREFFVDDVCLGIRTRESVPLLDERPNEDFHERTVPTPIAEADDKGVREPTSLYSAQKLEPRSLDRVQRLLEDFRGARHDFLRALRAVLDDVTGDERAALARQLAASFGELAHDPELVGLVKPSEGAATEARDARHVYAETELQRLAAEHLPEAPSVDDVDKGAFLARLVAVVRATTDGLALLDARSRDAETWSLLPSSGPGEELRAYLLDWKKEIEVGGVVGALVEDVRARYENAGVERREASRILASLSPQDVKLSADARWWSLFPFRALWKTYEARYAAALHASTSTLWRAYCARSRPELPTEGTRHVSSRSESRRTDKNEVAA